MRIGLIYLGLVFSALVNIFHIILIMIKIFQIEFIIISFYQSISHFLNLFPTFTLSLLTFSISYHLFFIRLHSHYHPLQIRGIMGNFLLLIRISHRFVIYCIKEADIVSFFFMLLMVVLLTLVSHFRGVSFSLILAFKGKFQVIVLCVGV